MKKFIYGSIVILLLVSGYFLIFPELEKVEVIQLKKKSFTETFRIEGRVRSKERQTVFAYATGVLSPLNFKVGDTLKRGQVFANLDWDRKEFVKSPIDGIITKIYRDSYGPINRGDPVIEVSSMNDLEVVVEMLTPETMRLSVNGRAQVLNWGKEAAIEAAIKKISRAGVIKVSALGIEEERTEVMLEPVEQGQFTANRLGDNFHVDVLFEVNRVENVLSVPLSALYKVDRDWAVFVVKGGRVQSQRVKVGLKNEESIIIEEGLSEDDVVVDFPSDRLKDGLKVQVRDPLVSGA